MIRNFLNSCHHSFAKSKTIVKLVILIRNQCYCIISYYFATSSNFQKNGESGLIDFLAGKCDTVLDVGANKGDWSAYVLNKNKKIKIVLFEPSINAFNILKERFHSVNNIILVNKGIGDEERKDFFFEEPDCGETSSVIQGVSNGNAKKVEIELTTLDSIFTEYELPIVDYLKIDVEGYDYFVLKGAEQNLKAKKIKFIQFEYNASWAMAGSTLIKAFSFLSDCGYKTFLLRWDGLYEFNYAKYGEFYRYSNFFAASNEYLTVIEPLIKGVI